MWRKDVSFLTIPRARGLAQQLNANKASYFHEKENSARVQPAEIASALQMKMNQPIQPPCYKHCCHLKVAGLINLILQTEPQLYTSISLTANSPLSLSHNTFATMSSSSAQEIRAAKHRVESARSLLETSLRAFENAESQVRASKSQVDFCTNKLLKAKADLKSMIESGVNEEAERKRRIERSLESETKRRRMAEPLGENERFTIVLGDFHGKKRSLAVKLSYTVGQLKAGIRRKTGICAESRPIIHTCKGVNICKRLGDDSLTLSHYKINKDSTVHLC